jgi:hypothetical protein
MTVSPGIRAQAGEVLDWLVSRAILPESDAVVRKHVDRFEMTQVPPGGWQASCSRKT